MKAAWRSDAGKVRSNNEDSIKIDAERGIFLLADGMGGHNAGEVASDLAVNAGYAYILNAIDKADDETAIFGVLEEALLRAHHTIKEKARLDIRLHGMGTTLIELCIKNDSTYLCHAGDSRAYLFRDTLQRLTRDHTVGDSWVEQGFMKREQVPSQQWHSLTQAVGIGDYPSPDKKSIGLKQGDVLLLCSDGLTDMLTDEEIEIIISTDGDDIYGIADSLIDTANSKGGKDNISVVIVQYH